jgi:hypothetical protein
VNRTGLPLSYCIDMDDGRLDIFPSGSGSSGSGGGGGGGGVWAAADEGSVTLVRCCASSGSSSSGDGNSTTSSSALETGDRGGGGGGGVNDNGDQLTPYLRVCVGDSTPSDAFGMDKAGVSAVVALASRATLARYEVSISIHQVG